MPDDRLLLETLALVRARGPIGERSLAGAVAHADRFVDAIPAGAASLLDLGSGGGLPGLVIAWRRPQLRVTLVERRGSRSDLLERAVRRLGLAATTVVAGDVAEVAATGIVADVVTARSFGPPALVVRWATALLGAGGTVLVSEPPVAAADRWDPTLLVPAGLVDEGVHQGIRVLHRVEPAR